MGELLTSDSTVILVKLTGVQLVPNFRLFMEPQNSHCLQGHRLEIILGHINSVHIPHTLFKIQDFRLKSYSQSPSRLPMRSTPPSNPVLLDLIAIRTLIAKV
jgi:hypothetical protein